jgi:hypothetical protein
MTPVRSWFDVEGSIPRGIVVNTGSDDLRRCRLTGRPVGGRDLRY